MRGGDSLVVMGNIDLHSIHAYDAYMKQITIRKVSDSGVDRARGLAKEKGVPLNDVFVQALESGLGLTGKAVTNGLEIFSGDSEFGTEWDRYLAEDLQKIDPEVWK